MKLPAPCRTLALSSSHSSEQHPWKHIRGAVALLGGLSATVLTSVSVAFGMVDAVPPTDCGAPPPGAAVIGGPPPFATPPGGSKLVTGRPGFGSGAEICTLYRADGTIFGRALRLSAGQVDRIEWYDDQGQLVYSIDQTFPEGPDEVFQRRGCSSDAVGCELGRYDPACCVILESDIRLSSAKQWVNRQDSGKYDIQSVMAHEVGHRADFQHVANNNLVMDPTVPQNNIDLRKLGQGDAKGNNSIY